MRYALVVVVVWAGSELALNGQFRIDTGEAEITEITPEQREYLKRNANATDAKKWLALSLGETIRLQLNPLSETKALSAMEGPAWIKE